MKEQLEKQEIEKLVDNFRGNLARGRAGATGIGVFIVVFERFNGKTRILLRTREEKNSLFGEDLSGKWELPGGGLEIADLQAFAKDDFPLTKYTSSISLRLKEELKEETGLDLILHHTLYPLTMFPAWLYKNGLIDLAFAVPVDSSQVRETEISKELMRKGSVRFFTLAEIKEIEFIAKRMEFLTRQVIASVC